MIIRLLFYTNLGSSLNWVLCYMPSLLDDKLEAWRSDSVFIPQERF